MTIFHLLSPNFKSIMPKCSRWARIGMGNLGSYACKKQCLSKCANNAVQANTVACHSNVMAHDVGHFCLWPILCPAGTETKVGEIGYLVVSPVGAEMGVGLIDYLVACPAGTELMLGWLEDSINSIGAETRVYR